MAYIVQQEDLDILKQGSQERFIKIELLNKDFQIIEKIEGFVISDDYTVSADSAIRRNYNVDLIVKNSSFLLEEGGLLWLDKYIKVYNGIKSLRDNEIRWYLLGTFLFSETSYKFDATNSTLSLSCVDMMGLLNDTINGQINGVLTTNITAFKLDESGNETTERNKIRDVIVAMLEWAGITNYIVEDMTEAIYIEELGTDESGKVVSNIIGGVIPSDQDFSTGCTVYEILSGLLELCTGWEMFFDIDGTFICQSYPIYDEDDIIIDSETLYSLVLSESSSILLGNVRNFVEIWGQCLDSDYYSEECTYADNVYSVNIQGLLLTDNNLISNNTRIAIKINQNNLDEPTMKIISDNIEVGHYPILISNTDKTNNDDEDFIPISADTLEQGKCYVFKYYKKNLYLQAQYQIHAVAMEIAKEKTDEEKIEDKVTYNCDNIIYSVNSDSPFCIEKIGLRKKVLSGDVYDDISTDNLAKERAEYELYKTTRLEETLTLECLNIPWLEVNVKVEYTSILTEQTHQYIIQNISGSSTNGTMTITMKRFYSLFENK